MYKFLYLGASWCASCKATFPKFKSICDNNNFEYESIDIESERGNDLCSTYEVMSIPTLIVLQDDEFVEKSVGSNDIIGTINKYV